MTGHEALTPAWIDDALQLVSLIRTAIDDPASLPEGEKVPGLDSFLLYGGDRDVTAEYAVDRCDELIALIESRGGTIERPQ